MNHDDLSGLLGVQVLHVPQRCVDEVIAKLRRSGQAGLEAVALWAGAREGSTFRVRETIIPRQTASRLSSGLLYSVHGDELHRINVSLYKAGLGLGVQIHSHPGAAYHSETDDAYPIVTVLGGTSIVVPNFGFGEVDVRTWAVYRLFRSGWEMLAPQEVSRFISVV